MAFVPLQFKIIVGEGKDILHVRIDFHLRQRQWLARQLQAGLFQMIGIQVHVAKSMNEFPRLKSRHLGDHQGQQGVGGNVKWNAQKEIGAALIELARQFAVGDVKLKQAMARVKLSSVVPN